MNFFSSRGCIALFALLFTFTVAAEQYGAPISGDNPMSVDKAIELADQAFTDPILVKAEVTNVCQAKGCWLALKNSEGDVRVTFEDYGFFVPPSLVGKTVLVEGAIEKKQLSLADSKHYVEDAGGDPATVTEAISEYSLVASGVRVLE